MNDKQLFHLGINIENYSGVAQYAILPGDPGRVDEIASFLYNPRIIACNREYKSVFGLVSNGPTHDTDIGVIVCSTGIGGPSAAIAMEELHLLGVKKFIRVGTCGGIKIDVQGGDIVIATSSVRQEGTSLQYAPIEFPATADFELTANLVKSAEELGYKDIVRTGIIQCKDSFYGQHNPDRMPVSFELKEKWDAWKRLGVLASEMESSTLFTVASALGCQAATVLSVVWNQERTNSGLSNAEIHDNNAAIKIALGSIK